MSAPASPHEALVAQLSQDLRAADPASLAVRLVRAQGQGVNIALEQALTLLTDERPLVIDTLCQSSIEGIPTDHEVGNHEAHAALEATLRAFGPVVLGIVLRFHFDTVNSMTGCSDLTISARRMQQLGFTTAQMQWPEKVLHPYYLDAAAPEDPEIEERLEKEIQSWRTTYLDMAS